MKVEHNNVVFWKGGKPIKVNVDQVETEGSKGLAREESTKEEQWQGKRIRSEGSTESSNNHERQHQSKRRPPVRRNWQKRNAPSSLVENTEVKRRPHENCKRRKRPILVSLPSGPGTRKMTRREAADEKVDIKELLI
ncbi:hypothetical protein NPIL_163091 [Nephila pilipes]|uniref:Uncharacterized protein n=1 Tax=Nephila pilipes TaxID=299642 RepID=A0A8X6U0U3_NEPPI|nr:hypothetical protein NPIL_163091 [Nephila pilipes]